MKQPQFKKVCQTLVLAGMLFMVLAGNQSNNKVESQIPDISQRINSFSMDLLKQFFGAKDVPANSILSPQSIFHNLAMSYIASGGDTREELRKIFHFPEKNKELIHDLKWLRQQLHKADTHKRIDVMLANSVWLDESYADYRKEYVRKIQNAFGPSLHRVSFKQREHVSNDINKWVSEKTRGKIQKSVDPADFISRSRLGTIDEPCLVAVDAIYFKADWGSRFDKDSTRKQSFHIDKSRTAEIPMMHQISMLSYSENEQFKFLELPYIDNQYSMYVILPQNIVGIRELMQNVTMEKIDELKQWAFVHEVDILFPKFEMKTHFGVKEALSAMGVKSAFSNQNADFEKMIIKNFKAFRIYISEIYHDAWIDVHEEGTEASAATSTVHFSFGCSAAPRRMLVQFHADHPFLFMIVHNESRSILFVGWISNPKEIAQ